MSVVGISSYVLITQKGRTLVPFVRGSGFLLKFETQSFYQYHVVTAGHVALPHRFGALYGNTQELKHIGDRHVSSKMHLFRPDGKRIAILPLAFQVQRPPLTDIALLRIEREKEIIKSMETDGLPPLEALDADTGPLQKGEEVVINGLHMTTEDTVADEIDMVPKPVTAQVVAKYNSDHFNTVLLASTQEAVTSGMNGCPVLRKSNGKCVGVLVGDVKRDAPSIDPKPLLETPKGTSRTPDVMMAQHEWRMSHMHAPFVDISSNGELMHSVGVHGGAFVPIAEFVRFMRKSEIM